jgi:hypothetical protein
MITIQLSRTKLVWCGLAALAVLAVAVLSGCGLGAGKILEPYNDAPVSHQISGPAEVGSMPDGFNNFAEKCDDHGNRVFVIFHSNSAYGSVFAMKDPTCGR